MGDGPGGPDGAAPGTEGDTGISPGTAGNLGITGMSPADAGVTGNPSTSSATAINALLNAIPVVGPVLSAIDFGAQAKGDPGFSPGVSGPEGNAAQGGGPGEVSKTIRDIQTALPQTRPQQSVLPAAVEPISLLADELRRKRIGRQETILTRRGALSEAPTYKPTLLGQ